ncbi:cell wall metabolism sensor histidine kinase WalK [Enterococcus cecorum]|uniref:cell wall metabolism sensor histidine kinase WalK n=1 Tax=Enterococcus cecorum TaxID=44008 RepID=UPI00148E8879|nr:cell wall metabolism sensor histidine kinase WalK [Enterococcus cecorum]MDZ5502764.1 cell wall metabolism sensor histidine kinase WalK [Enterococcus cecorum]MDZ5509014.1 cell wall metabolism sensor histidine kinase WalK [Enterococcus cecorum]MDZ5556758.1 cell wall metabolism sensor histidine kinase WalK [Enterococcus cecorum]MDZ5558637.1 cell wall metabolism sensor histidine kinase WalK [Enterococcus cecorum]MDZ5571407.1 cell wall metabolism sensor histidine kinase WalK [Enterococcus cecoru
MRERVRFFQSVNFKIALTFILILLISIEIIGAYFIRGLEKSIVDNYTKGMDTQVAALANTLSSELDRDQADDETIQANIQRLLDNSSTSEMIEMRVVDEKGIVLATTDVSGKSAIGKKNDYQELDDFTIKSMKVADKDTHSRVLINVHPIQSMTGDTVLGALYVKSDIEDQYQQIKNIAVIFVTASLLAVGISMVVAILIAHSITQPIGEMREQALRIARGDYSRKVTVHGKDELGQLALTFNQLAEQIEETQDAMESERNRLNSVLSHMSDGVVATDRRGKVITINDMALSLLGISKEAAIGQNILNLLDIEKDYTLRKILESTEELLIERNESNYGDNKIIRVEFSMIRRESGFISGLVAVMHDVTEQEQNERDRREFVSNVSHELRTPLTSMRSYIETLSEGAWQDQEMAPRFLKITLDETDRMIRMINDLLDLSRMDNDNLKLNIEMVNFNELVNFVLDRFDVIIANSEKKYRIVREFTQRPLFVEVDTDRMIQVIDNIMNNAIKYSPDGGKITVRLMETHNNVILSITDQGLGIPKKDISRIFERFYRVDKARARKQGGTGLGLAISKEVVKALGGTIWATSIENYGSTFYISLPYEPFEEEWWD